MRKDNIETTEVKIQSRRQFIIKTGLLTGVAMVGCIVFLDACSIFESTDEESSTQSQTPNYTLPIKISRIVDLPEVTAAVRTEKEQLSSFSDELRQFQLDMNELDTILVQLGRTDDISEISEELSLKLQMAMDRKSKFISTLSQIMKKISTTQDTLVQNIK
jgi:hypothetical protein